MSLPEFPLLLLQGGSFSAKSLEKIMMDENSSHPLAVGEVAPEIKEQLNCKRQLCKAMKEIPVLPPEEFRAEIARLRAEYDASAAPPPEYAEWLDKEFAEAVNKLGFYISASGIITFKSGADVANVFKDYPIDKILIETDSPYLAPVPYRGKVNEPAYVVKTAEKMAEIKGLTIEEIARITMNNFYSLYQKAKRF